MVKVTSHKKKLISMLGDISDCTVLDYGCGRGDFVELLLKTDGKPQSIWAVDSSVGMIDVINSSFMEEINNGIVVAKIVSNPEIIKDQKFNKIICHNVLECIGDKIKFINEFDVLLADYGTFVLSHHDFDSSVFNSNHKNLTRELVHCFADTKQNWQEYSDGQMGRKIPGLMSHSVFKDYVTCQTIRVVETEFKSGNYGYLMADMLLSIGKSRFDTNMLKEWYHDLEDLYKTNNYYFAIDLVAAIVNKGQANINL